jgi:hypothetical protein
MWGKLLEVIILAKPQRVSSISSYIGSKVMHELLD